MFRFASTLILGVAATLIFTIGLNAQVDANTLLLLKFENSLNGEQGETPTTSTGHSYQAGIQGQGALLPNPNNLRYSSANNINATEGTVEFWMKPTWAGSDGLGHSVISWGGGGGMIIAKDGANNLRIILNRFGTFPGGERGVAVNIGSWAANQWHHVAFTYSNTTKSLTVYTDGTQRAQSTFTGDIPAISSSTFQIGGDGAGDYIQSVVDEMRISNIARTPQEIANSFMSALTVTGLTATPNTMQMLPTWWKAPVLQAVTNVGTLNIPPTAASWTTSDAGVASFDPTRGKIIANGAGTANLVASLNGTTANVAVTVTAPVLQPTVDLIDTDLSTPAVDGLWEMPVVIINYLPTADGINMNMAVSNENMPVADMKARIERINIQHKFMLEEGSRFRGYGGPAVAPSLSYRVVAVISVYEEMLPLDTACDGNGVCQPDYEQILARFNGSNYVNTLGVKEFWIWGYHFGNISPVESNMSSPATGDISNSYRLNDLPVYNKTYVLYNYNFGRSSAEATHNHGHQLEAIYGYTNQRQDGNTQLFWQRFVGRASNGAWQMGRSGDCHHPPNAVADYDYSNTTPFPSDIADWRPLGGGATQPVSLSTWRNINYAFPDGVAPSQDDNWWYIYWFQSMPGRNNTIPYNTNRMTNWWQFTGDWDAAYRAGVGLYEAASCSYGLSASTQNFPTGGGTGSVTVTAGAGCKWFASSNGMWVPLTSGDVGNGNGVVNFTVSANTAGAARSTKIIVAGQPVVINQDAAAMTVSGRVTNAIGRGIKGATVSMTDALNITTTVRTDAFGRYAFQNVRSGEVYTVSVANRRYTFTPQQIFVNDNLTNIDFVGSLPARPDDDVKGEWAARFW